MENSSNESCLNQPFFDLETLRSRSRKAYKEMNDWSPDFINFLNGFEAETKSNKIHIYIDGKTPTTQEKNKILLAFKKAKANDHIIINIDSPGGPMP